MSHSTGFGSRVDFARQYCSDSGEVLLSQIRRSGERMSIIYVPLNGYRSLHLRFHALLQLKEVPSHRAFVFMLK